MKSGLLIKSGLWITYATFVNRIFAFLSSLVLARLLQPSDFGIIGIAYVFWSFFTLFIQDTAGTFIIYKGTEDSRYVNTSYTISLLIGLILAIGMGVASPFIASFFNEPGLTGVLIAFSFNLLLSSASQVYSGLMTRQMKFRALANIGLVASVIRLICTAIAALCGLSYWSFVIGDTASNLINWVLMRYYSGHRFRLQIDSGVRSEVVSFCLGANGSSFGFYANFNLDNFTVAKLLGSASLGYYNLAYQITATISTLFRPVLNQLGVPIFAQLPSDEHQKNALLKVVEQIAFLVAPLCALIFLIVDPITVTVLFGEKWLPILPLFPGLLFFTYFRVLNSPLYSMLIAKGRPDINALVNLQIAPLAVLGFFIGARQGGIVGVSIAVALILGVVWTTYWWWTACRKLHWSPKQFFFAGLIPLALVLPSAFVVFNLPLLLKPFVFLIIYALGIRLLAPQQFFQYKSFMNKVTNKLMALRHS